MNIHPFARRSILKLSLPAPWERESQRRANAVDFSSNTNSFLSHYSSYPAIEPSEIKEAYLNFLQQESLLRLKQMGPCELSICSENLLFTLGITEGIDLLLRAFCEPNRDKIGFTPPTFPMYEHWANAYDLEAISSPLLGDDFDELNVSQLCSHNQKLIFLCNPNNPVGSTLAISQVKDLLRKANSLVIVDEAYIEFSSVDSLANLVGEYPNLIVLRTFSKGWGLAGVRCGVIIAHPEVIHTLKYIQVPFPFSQPSQEEVLGALNDFSRQIDSWNKSAVEREILKKGIQRSTAIKRVYSSQTNFLCIQAFPERKLCKYLSDNNILFSGAFYLNEDHIRITVDSRNSNAYFSEILKAFECPRVSNLSYS